MERIAQTRVIFGASTKKEKSRNPHGYWIFRWRRVWDSNPRALADNRISSAARYDHFDNSPYMFSRRFSPPFSEEKGLWKELTERTANYLVFRTGQNPRGYKVFGGRNGQLPAGFRVSPVMTASIPLHRKRRCTRCPFIIAKRRASVNEKSCEAGIWREKSVWAAWDCAERGSAQKKMCYNNFQEGACAKARKCGAGISLQGAGIYITQRKRGPGGWNL